MPETPREQAVAEQLRRAGARFAFVHGSRATGEHTRPDSDLDVAAWWGNGAPDAWTVALPAAVDLLVLDGAPLWLAGLSPSVGACSSTTTLRLASRGRPTPASSISTNSRESWSVSAGGERRSHVSIGSA